MSKACAPAIALAASLAPLALVPAQAGTVRGRLELADKGGRGGGDLQDAVVWVDGPKVKPRPASATVEMRNKSFVPRVVVVGVGGSVEFPNADPVFHNVFSA